MTVGNNGYSIISGKLFDRLYLDYFLLLELIGHILIVFLTAGDPTTKSFLDRSIFYY